MRAALHRAAKTGNSHRGRALDGGRRRAHRKAPRSGAHASRWCIDELPERAPRPPRLRAERRAGHNSFSSRTRVGPSELYGYDAHRNIAFLTDGTGAETDTYDYDAWGNLVASTGSTPNSRLFVGEEFDPDLGLINLRARQYRAVLGRFLTIDPLDAVATAAPKVSDANTGVLDPDMRALLPLVIPNQILNERLLAPGGQNRYQFASSDPVLKVDPSGRDTIAEYVLTILQDYTPIADRAIGLYIARRFNCLAVLLGQLSTCHPSDSTCIGRALAATTICELGLN